MNNQWNKQIVACWKDKCGAPPPYYHMKRMKAIVQEHGVDVVKRVMEVYLESTAVEYISLNAFMNKFKLWKNKVIPPARKENPYKFVPH